MNGRRGYTPAPNQNAQVAKQSGDSLISDIQKFIPELGRALPRHLGADRMARIITTEVRKNPKLAECDRASFFGAILQCAQLGLEPGSALGHAYLIPRRTKSGGYEVQLTIGFQGMLDLAERDGRLTIEANVVYENEFFDIDYGTNSRIVHKPSIGGDRGPLIGAYAIAHYKDGRAKFRFLSIQEIEEARKSAASSTGPWQTHYTEMARKTAVRRLFKMLPKSIEMAQVIDLEDKLEIGESQNLRYGKSSFQPDISVQSYEDLQEIAEAAQPEPKPETFKDEPQES